MAEMGNADNEAELFGNFEGAPVHQVTLRNANGAVAKVLTWGAVIRDLQVPDGQGVLRRVVLGFEEFAPYPEHSPYFGALVGRFANRIGGGGFTLNGRRYDLVVNEGDDTCLHGGPDGFSRRIWQIEALSEQSVTLSLRSDDGDMGFPGQVLTTCTYTLSDDNVLVVDTTARTDAETYVNLAQHSYFTLDGSGDLNGHVLQVFADHFTPVDDTQIPLGTIEPVAGSALDFTSPRLLGAPDAPDVVDHNFVLSGEVGDDGMRIAARLTCAKTGLELTVATTKPGVQVYNGCSLNVAAKGLGGATYGPRAAICLETQYFPDAPNQPWADSALLLPDQTYAHRTEYRFSTK